MTIAAAKEKLHDYIDSADDKKVKELLSFVENGAVEEHKFTAADVAAFDKEWDGHLAGDGQSVSLDEFKKSTQSYLEKKLKDGL